MDKKIYVASLIAVVLAVSSVAIALTPLWHKNLTHQIMVEGIQLLVCSPAYPTLDSNPYHLKQETSVLHTWSDGASSGENGILLAVTEINALVGTPLYMTVSCDVTKAGVPVEGLIIDVTATYITMWAREGGPGEKVPGVQEHDSYSLTVGTAWTGFDYTKMTWFSGTPGLYDPSTPNALRLEFTFEDTEILGTIAGLLDIAITLEVGKV